MGARHAVLPYIPELLLCVWLLNSGLCCRAAAQLVLLCGVQQAVRRLRRAVMVRAWGGLRREPRRVACTASQRR